jgi:tetratricopeptide (TPR) repeat protein
MKKFFLSACLILTLFASAAGAQFFTSETTRKAGEKLQKGDREGALAVLDKAIEKRKDLLEAYQMRANLRVMGGDLGGAISDFTSALELSPNDPKIYERRALIRIFMRDHAGALKDFDAAIANGSKSERVFTGRAALKRDTGDTDGAIADFQAALAVNPNLATAENGLVSLMEHQKGDLDGALVHLQEFLDRYESKRGGKLPNINVESPPGSGVLIRPGGKDMDGSQVAMTVTGVMSPVPVSSAEEAERQGLKFEQLMNLAIAYGNLGRMYAKKNDSDKALENYEKGLTIRGNDAYIHKLRSEARIKKGDLQGAIEDLKAVAESNEEAPDVHLSRGLLLVLQGKDDEAEKEFATHLQMFPASRDYLNERVKEVRKLRSEQPQQ